MSEPTKIDVLELSLNGTVEIADVQETTEKDFSFEPVKDRKFLLYVKNNDSNDITVTINAGDYFQNKKLGNDNDAAFAEISENAVHIFGPFESARFKDKDGAVQVTVDTEGTAGTDEDVDIAVIELD